MGQTTPSMTGKQKRDLRKLLTDALDEMVFSKDAAQNVLGKGGALKARVKEILAQLAPSLLEAVGTATVPAIGTFRAVEHFKDGSGPVVIDWINDDFRKAFLTGDGNGVVEGAVAEATLRIHKLAQASVDGPIIAELGETVAETTLGQMYEMMKAQGHGEQGNLLTNGEFNIFYVRDADNILWTVYCCYWKSAWYVCAGSVTCPNAWRDGCQVISR